MSRRFSEGKRKASANTIKREQSAKENTKTKSNRGDDKTKEINTRQRKINHI